jgi:hypothetical protein
MDCQTSFARRFANRLALVGADNRLFRRHAQQGAAILQFGKAVVARLASALLLTNSEKREMITLLAIVTIAGEKVV